MQYYCEKMDKKQQWMSNFLQVSFCDPFYGANPSTTKHYYKEVFIVYQHNVFRIGCYRCSKRKDKSYLISYAFTSYSTIHLFHILIISHDTYISLIFQLYVVELLSFQRYSECFLPSIKLIHLNIQNLLSTARKNTLKYLKRQMNSIKEL